MRVVLGKYWPLFLIAVLIQLAVIFTVLVRFFAVTNPYAAWLLSFICDNTMAFGGLSVFNFFIDWAEALSIAAVYIISIPLFMAIITNRRKQALTRVHFWAMDAIQKLTEPSNEESVMKQLDDWEKRLRNIIDNSNSALTDTRAIGNGLKPKVEKAVENLQKLEDCVNNYPEPTNIRNLLLNTVLSFKEISTAAFDALNQSR